MWPQYGAGHGKTQAKAPRGAKRPPRSGEVSAVQQTDEKSRFWQSTGLILGAQPLTIWAVDAYITPLGAPRLPRRGGAPAKPLTVYTVNRASGHDLNGHVGCAGFGGSGACRRRGRKVPGCLTGKSEERETWTAESLRAASSNGEGISFLARASGRTRLRRSTFQVNTMVAWASNRLSGQSGTSSK